MAVTLTKSSGDTLQLGCMVGGAFVPSFHVAGWSDTSDVPGTVYPGYDGEEVDERAVRVSARSYTVRGWLRADTPAELERLVDQLQGWVNTKEELRLQRSETDDKFVLVRKVSFAHDYVFKTGRRQCNVSITFKASDPYRYAVDETHHEEEITELREPMHLLDVMNAGSADSEPLIVIEGRTVGGVHTENVRLRSYRTGRVVEYAGQLKEGELLILDTAQRSARLFPSAIAEAGTAAAGGPDNITLAAGASDADGAYVGQIIRIVGGAGEGQTRRITGYNGQHRIAMVADWDEAPDGTSEYEIYRAALLPGYWLDEVQLGEFSQAQDVGGAMNSGYIVYGFPLEPGRNQVEVNADTEHMKVSLVYRARWY